MADTLRFRWQVADGSLHMTWTADAVELNLDTARRVVPERGGLDAPDVLSDPAPLRGWVRA